MRIFRVGIIRWESSGWQFSKHRIYCIFFVALKTYVHLRNLYTYMLVQIICLRYILQCLLQTLVKSEPIPIFSNTCEDFFDFVFLQNTQCFLVNAFQKSMIFGFANKFNEAGNQVGLIKITQCIQTFKHSNAV